MRAWVFTSRGTPAEVLKLRDDLPQPKPEDLKPNEVLIKVSHAGLFQGFASIMGILPHFNNKPWFPDMDFSGTAVAVGSKVSNLKEGDAIFGGLTLDVMVTYGGVVAEYIVLPDHVIYRKPENISFETAGGVAAHGVTAVQFAEVTNMKPGQKVLVTGASGGTGSLVVQAARAAVGKEGKVIGTCSGANEELVRNLGVDEVIDYKVHPVLHDYLIQNHSSQPFDVIIDIVGSDELLYPKSPAYLKPEGVFLFGGNMGVTHHSPGVLDILKLVISIRIKSIRPVLLGGVPRKCWLHSGKVDQKSLRKLSEMIEHGQIRGVVDSVWEMADVLKGYERLATSRARGRVIVHVQS